MLGNMCFKVVAFHAKNTIFIHSQALIVQDGPLAFIFGIICIFNQSTPLQFLLSLQVSLVIVPSSGDVHISKL
jgi:hypothetical protein